MKRIILLVVVLLAACAPADLDITPTPVPTEIPKIEVYITGAVVQPETMLTLDLGSRVADAIEAAGGASEDADLERINLAQEVRDGAQIHVPRQGETVAEVTPEAEVAEEASASPNQVMLEHIIASLPGTINAGVISWRRDLGTEVTYVEREGGMTARATFNEAGGGLMELTYGVFDTPEIATAYYETVREQLPTLDRAQERDQFPTPNAFGGGTYGSDAIFVRDNVFIRVSIPRFSSTAGDPLNPMARPAFNILDEALATFGQSS
jgi:DNA uptake protein ComE-like DNA-binding protein